MTYSQDLRRAAGQGAKIVCVLPPYEGRTVTYLPRVVGDSRPWSVDGEPFIIRYSGRECRAVDGDGGPWVVVAGTRSASTTNTRDLLRARHQGARIVCTASPYEGRDVTYASQRQGRPCWYLKDSDPLVWIYSRDCRAVGRSGGPWVLAQLLQLEG